MPSTPSANEPSLSRWRLGLVVGGAAMFGVVAIAVYVPELAAAFGEDPAELPAWLPLAAAVQPAVLVAVAAAVGAALAPKLGLHTPAAEAITTGQLLGKALRPQLVPGLVGGLFGTALLTGLGAAAPDAIAALQRRFDPPLYVRVLYGGITEEVLLRWGLMTALVWGAGGSFSAATARLGRL